jgi:hypothetical protein
LKRGVILGTVDYMSPEHRRSFSRIFGIGEVQPWMQDSTQVK